MLLYIIMFFASSSHWLLLLFNCSLWVVAQFWPLDQGHGVSYLSASKSMQNGTFHAIHTA